MRNEMGNNNVSGLKGDDQNQAEAKEKSPQGENSGDGLEEENQIALKGEREIFEGCTSDKSSEGGDPTIGKEALDVKEEDGIVINSSIQGEEVPVESIDESIEETRIQVSCSNDDVNIVEKKTESYFAKNLSETYDDQIKEKLHPETEIFEEGNTTQQGHVEIVHGQLLKEHDESRDLESEEKRRIVENKASIAQVEHELLNEESFVIAPTPKEKIVETNADSTSSRSDLALLGNGKESVEVNPSSYVKIFLETKITDFSSKEVAVNESKDSGEKIETTTPVKDILAEITIPEKETMTTESPIIDPQPITESENQDTEIGLDSLDSSTKDVLVPNTSGFSEKVKHESVQSEINSEYMNLERVLSRNLEIETISGRVSTGSIQDKPSVDLEHRKSPSFVFDLPIEPRLEESDQTPLLYHNKAISRSISSPRTLSVSVEEKTIQVERSDSDKLKGPFVNFLKDEGKEEFVVNPQKTEENALTKGRPKRKPRASSLFTTCICCAAAIS